MADEKKFNIGDILIAKVDITMGMLCDEDDGDVDIPKGAKVRVTDYVPEDYNDYKRGYTIEIEAVTLDTMDWNVDPAWFELDTPAPTAAATPAAGDAPSDYRLASEARAQQAVEDFMAGRPSAFDAPGTQHDLHSTLDAHKRHNAELDAWLDEESGAPDAGAAGELPDTPTPLTFAELVRYNAEAHIANAHQETLDALTEARKEADILRKECDFHLKTIGKQALEIDAAISRAERAEAALLQVQQMAREFIDANRQITKVNSTKAFWRIAHIEKIARAAAAERGEGQG